MKVYDFVLNQQSQDISLEDDSEVFQVLKCARDLGNSRPQVNKIVWFMLNCNKNGKCVLQHSTWSQSTLNRQKVTVM